MKQQSKSKATILALLTVFLPVLLAKCLSAQEPANFSGQRAFGDIRQLVAFGPRPPGSEPLAESRQWIIHQLLKAGCHVEQDPFTASTPIGPIKMTNIIATIPGASPSVIILAGHYDTKLFNDIRFVGANDGGSSAAFCSRWHVSWAGEKINIPIGWSSLTEKRPSKRGRQPIASMAAATWCRKIGR